MLRIITLIILFFFSIEQSVSAKNPKKPSTPCHSGYNYIKLASDPRGYVCLGSDLYETLQTNLSSYQTQIRDGGNAVGIIDEIRQSMKNAADPRYESWVGQYPTLYAILLDRIKSYSDVYCHAYAQKPTLDIGKSGIYDGYSLTPSCHVTLPKRPTFPYRLDIRISANGATFFSSGGTFSGTMIERQETGKHQITCEYQPSFCRTPLTYTRDITITTPVQVKNKNHSIARLWNEVMLDAIRTDRVRPPIQARNLFHFGAMTYDIWALYHPNNQTYLFGNKANTNIRSCLINHAPISGGEQDIVKAISYASYRLIAHRYSESPGYRDTMIRADAMMNSYGYDISYTGSNITKKIDPASLGNALAECYIQYGKQDGSNEAGVTEVAGENGSYANQHYTPINPAIDFTGTGGGNTTIIDWNRWQPIGLETFIDQAGNPIPGGAATFIGAEWGNVKPFSLRQSQQTIHERDGQQYISYLDPGLPPQATGSTLALWRWNYELVTLWSSHLDGADQTMIDTSPARLGASIDLPRTFSGMLDFYDMKSGGIKTLGHPNNPKTNKPYIPNIMKRGDYTRAIAEFWADGPRSETPPGHWFTIWNTVTDNLNAKQWGGQGRIMDDLEYDAKGYFTLGGALHDAAIAAWGTKGAYDTIRPVSAIRAMATAGQSSDSKLPHYSPMGWDLIPGYIELVQAGDPLEGKNGNNIGKVKIRAWKGPKYIADTSTDAAGVGWILAENWWPYQRPSFVTPPFAGYVSGHSTFSRAAAETLTAITGDAYFPGGLMEVPLRARNYLVFEQGPTADIKLQWATYRDAADESALSRIWGGIHPPMDDIPGRIMGEQIGKQAVEYANQYFGK